MADALPHVVHVISSVDPRAGGTTTQLAALVRAQVELGMTVTVVSTYLADFDPSAAEAMQNAGAYVELVGPSTTVMAWHPKLSRVLRSVMVNNNLVHIHGLWEEIQHRAAVISREMGLPYLFSLHGTLEPWSMHQSRFKKQIYMAVRMKRNLAGAAALHYADRVEQELTATWKLSNPAIIQPYAIDLDAFERVPSPGLFRRAFPQIGNAPYVLFLGRLHPRKGLDVLIPAFKFGAPPNTMLVIAGPSAEPEYENDLHSLVKQHDLTDRVVFTGMLEGNIRTAAYAEAQLCVVPSHSDNFGTTAIESLACGTPVIVSDHVALSRTIAMNHVGEVCALESHHLAKIIQAWMNDPDRCQQSGHRGKEWVFENFNARKASLSWAQHYDEILKKQVRPRAPVLA